MRYLTQCFLKNIQGILYFETITERRPQKRYNIRNFLTCMTVLQRVNIVRTGSDICLQCSLPSTDITITMNYTIP